MNRLRKTRKTAGCPVSPVRLVISFLAVILLVGCSRQRPVSEGVSQLPVDESSTSLPAPAGNALEWHISFINDQPLTYSQEAENTFVTGPDYTAEMTFSTVVDREVFERVLSRSLKPTGGDLAMTWENDTMVLFDLRGCSGRARVDLRPLARQTGLETATPLIIYCGTPQNIMRWSADRGTEVIGSIPAGFSPAMANSDHSAIFYHRLKANDSGTDVGVWLSDFSTRTLKLLAVHYLGAGLRSDFLESSSLAISTGGDDVQVFGGSGVRVRQYDPEDLGLIVGMEVDARGQIALFDGTTDGSGRSGQTRLRLLDRNLVEISRIDDVGRLSRLSGEWRTVDAVWLDLDTIAYIHWNNRFYGVVAIANLSSLTVTKTDIVADELAGVLSDGRFVVRRQAGGRAGCWRIEASDGSDTTPLCDRLPGPDRAQVSPDGSLVALRHPGERAIDVWNRASRDSRTIGRGEIGGWTRAGELIWLTEREPLVVSDDGFL